MRILLIGPIYPYKGGISHYTRELYKALVKNGHEVVVHSFKFQYPKLLYKKEQKDERNPQFKIDNVQYSIHTANPFNWCNEARRIKRENPDLVIFQWWHPYFAPCFWTLGKLLRRKKIVFICHNVFPHERFPMDRWLTQLVLKRGDYFVTHSHMDAEDLLSIKKEAVYTVTPHPTYNVFKLENMTREAARELLGIKQKEKVLLFFGFVREYKGLSFLIEAMPSIHRRIPDVKLWIVGDFGEDRDSYFEKMDKLGINDYVNVVEGYIADNQVEPYFAACNLVVLPYLSATQSGIVQIAYGFERPVLVTNVGGLPDVVKNDSTGYVVVSQSSEAISDATIEYFEKQKEDEFAANIRKEEERFSWDTFVRKLLDVTA